MIRKRGVEILIGIGIALVVVSALGTSNSIFGLSPSFGNNFESGLEKGLEEARASSPDGDIGNTRPQCRDRIDNDGDGLVDYPSDPDCSSAEDDTENFYEICTVRDLDRVREDLSGHYNQRCDIDLNLLEFIPIGFGLGSFSGSYNGNFYSIINMRIDNSDSGAGLFNTGSNADFSNIRIIDASVSGERSVGSLVGFAAGSRFNNITLEDVKIAGEDEIGGLAGRVRELFNGERFIPNEFYGINVINSEVEGSSYVGGIVGQTDLTTIDDSRFEGEVTVQGEEGFVIGGLVGLSQNTFISNSYTEGSIVGDGGSWSDDLLGGLVGWFVTSTVINSSSSSLLNGEGIAGGLVGTGEGGNIIQSHFVGNVSTFSIDPQASHFSGGLAGVYSGRIRDSFSKAAVHGGTVGGIAGKLRNPNLPGLRNSSNVIEGTWSESSLSNDGDREAFGMGGFFGEATNCTINNSNSNVEFKINDIYTSSVGGLIGWSNGCDIYSSYSYSDIVNNSHKVNTAGGLIGRAQNRPFVIGDSFSESNISAKSEFGGLIGDVSSLNNDNLTIKNSYFQGSLLDLNLNILNDKAGGLIGRNSNSRIQIINSYAASEFDESIVIKGGVIGSSDNGRDLVITFSYWDTNLSRIEVPCGTDSEGCDAEGRSTGEMTSVPRPENTYVDWSFVDEGGSVWNQFDGNYPYLI